MNTKSTLLSSVFCLAAITNLFSQVTTVTVSTGAAYANQKWYSLSQGEVGSAQSKDNWDLAFEITGYSSAILANTQKSNFALYAAPFSIANYNTVDTTGISTWTMLYNSDSSWAIGAFNRGANPSNPSDLGWGIYDMNTHFVNGDSCYVIKLNATTYKKLKITSLISGAYNFEYADINGANSHTHSISKSSYTGKNFAYFNLSTASELDREPVSNSWDLTFNRYHAFIPTPYPVVGVMQNKGVTVAQVDNIANPASYTDWSSQTFQSKISTLGHDWKSFDLSSNSWKIVQDTIYFIKDKQNNIWKLCFLSFGGSATGDFVFTQEKLSAVGIQEESASHIMGLGLYPNPNSGNNTQISFYTEAVNENLNIRIIDLNGKLLYKETKTTQMGANLFSLSHGSLAQGIYLVQVQEGKSLQTLKLIITQ